MIGAILAHLDFLDEQIKPQRSDRGATRPFRGRRRAPRAASPASARPTAEATVAEIGVDMERVPYRRASRQLGRNGVPGNDQSAGKRRSGRTR